MSDPRESAIDIPATFAESFIAKANAANEWEDDELDLSLAADRRQLHLSNSAPGFSPYLVLAREGSAVRVLICSGSEIDASADVDLSNPQEAATVALSTWHSTL